MMLGLDVVRHLIGKDLNDEQWEILKEKYIKQAEERNGQDKMQSGRLS